MKDTKLFKEVAGVIGEELAERELSKISPESKMKYAEDLLSAFRWHETPQGEGFWSLICRGFIPDALSQEEIGVSPRQNSPHISCPKFGDILHYYGEKCVVLNPEDEDGDLKVEFEGNSIGGYYRKDCFDEFKPDEREEYTTQVLKDWRHSEGLERAHDSLASKVDITMVQLIEFMYDNNYVKENSDDTM